jgi:hypothetical protein
MGACGVSGTVAVGALSVAVTIMLLALNLSTELGGYGAGASTTRARAREQLSGALANTARLAPSGYPGPAARRSPAHPYTWRGFVEVLGKSDNTHLERAARRALGYGRPGTSQVDGLYALVTAAVGRRCARALNLERQIVSHPPPLHSPSLPPLAGVIFAYHPVFMCLAFLLFMPLGMLSYKADLGEKVRPPLR